MAVAKKVYVVGTADTKKDELLFAAEQLKAWGLPVVTVDAGVNAGPGGPGGLDVRPADIASGHPAPWELPDRGQAVGAMAQALRDWLLARHRAGEVAGLFGMGGSGGTILCSTAFTALPLTIPKLIVSTMASGDTRGYVGESDLVLVPALVDLAGVNRISATVLARAAGALAGMVRAAEKPPAQSGKPLVAATMFGVTTPCVTRARSLLEALGNEVLVFHATGAGGRAMEKLVAADLVQGVLDVTTTEVADEVVGGVLTAGPDRMDVLLARRIPYVLSLGALDMVNFGARSTVPARFEGRLFHEHNAQVTLMRTTVAENRQIGEWIGRKLEQAPGRWTLVIPQGGVSALDTPGKPFHHPEALQALVAGLKSRLSAKPGHTVVESPLHINDPAFAETLVAEYHKLIG
jgi:uncharacterized protein (UPF0261 family)